MNKRGANQIDWVISLIIFLLYIAWFFLLIKPHIEKQTNNQEILPYIKEKILKQYIWNVTETPIFIYSNITAKNHPIILTSPIYNSHAALAGVDYVLDNDRLIFLSNLSTGENYKYNFMSCTESYHSPSTNYNILSNQTATTVPRLQMQFTDNLFDQAIYRGSIHIYTTQYSINQQPLTGTAYHNQTRFLAIYRLSNPEFNHTSYIFADNTQIINYLDINDLTDTSYTMVLNLNLTNYTRYHANAGFFGPINYTKSYCYNTTTDILDLNNQVTGLAIIASTPSLMQFCSQNNTINFNMTIYNSTRYSLVFHLGDHTTTQDQNKALNTKIGLTTIRSGMSLTAINNSINHSALKTLWNLPSQTNFEITISNDSSIVKSIKTDQPTADQNIYVNQIQTYALQKDLSRIPITINIRTW